MNAKYVKYTSQILLLHLWVVKRVLAEKAGR